jgi:hypothetical protein
MKNCPALIIFIFVCAAFINGERKNDTIFDQLYALEGKWIMYTKKGSIGEEWTKISKDYLQSRDYETRGDDTIPTERVALRNTKEGIFYISTVEYQNNKEPVTFRLTSANNNIFVFENSQHDYPKRISYSFINKDSLYARIDDGKEIPKKISAFRYSRQK